MRIWNIAHCDWSINAWSKCSASDVYTPVSGEVVEINQSIVDDPSKINADPEGGAWFFKLKLKDKSELDTLMNKEEYDKFAKESS